MTRHTLDASSVQKPAALFCEYCGAQLIADSRFCQRCGSPTADPACVPSVETYRREQPAQMNAMPATFRTDSAPSSKRYSRLPQGLSGMALVLLVLSLLLPWMQISCGSIRVDIEGHRLLLGTVHEKFDSLVPPQTNNQMLNSKESPNVFLILWASEVVLGSLIGLASVNTGARIVTLVSAGLGGFFLLVFYVATNQDLQKQMVQGMGMIAIQWSSGLWVAAAATGAVGAAGILGLADSS